MNKKHSIYMVLAVLLALSVGSCNSSNDDLNTSEIISSNSYTSTLVSSFTLGNNDKVLYNLDSVFFSIDQDKNLIYNADSLPKGTDVSHLTVSVTFPSAVGKAVFKVKDSNWMEEKEVEYSSETTDTIDFTSDVELEVTSQDGKVVRSYTVSVNVHNIKPDSLYWNQRARRDLPNTSGAPKMSKAVEQNGKYFCLVADQYGYVLSTASDPGQGTWQRKTVAFDFAPDVMSLVAADDALYILSTFGELYKSTDEGSTWSSCGVVWRSIKGAYGAKVLGVLNDGGVYKHDEFPRGSYVPQAVDALFPISGSSEFVMASNTWTETQQGMLVGGIAQDGTVVNGVWGYDGTNWGRIDSEILSTLPALEGAALVPYTSLSTDSVSHRMTKRTTWLVLGGRKADGTMNTTTYVTYNQGIGWSNGGLTLQLPSYMPPFVYAQAFVKEETVKKVRTNAPVKPVTEWQTPYIYLVGGLNYNGNLLNSIWKGVINQLSFKPLY